jgi:lipid-binding SYLF domain-containing protein
MKTKFGNITILTLLFAIISFTLQVSADEMGTKSTKTNPGTMGTTQKSMTDNNMADRNAAEKTITDAGQLFEQAAASPAESIPSSVVKDAAGIAVFPGLVNAALVAGGSYGSGVIMAKEGKDRWSPPLFVSLTGGSIGAQAGVETSDLILVFENRKALDMVGRGGHFELGVDAAVAAGKVGKEGSASTEKADILAYRRSSGLFAGVSLKGTVLEIKDGPTIAYYDLHPGKKGTRAYYGTEPGLYSHVIGGKKGSAISELPESAKHLQKAINNYFSR